MCSSLNDYLAELHVHTVLSPCAGVEMIPPLIVDEALRRGIQVIAITDHNATANVEAVQKAGWDSGLVVIAGMEVQTKEEVHLLCLFDELEQLEAWQKLVKESLPAKENNAEFFGEQFVVDETGEFIRNETQLLITSTTLSFDEAFMKVLELEGLPIPAHVDREAFGLFANLGFIPNYLPIEAVEISTRITLTNAYKKFPSIKDYAVIQSGDVHYLSDFLGVNHFHIAQPTVKEMKLAFRGVDGRKFFVN